MPIVPLFLFKLSVSLALVWCFYQVVLRRLTFHRLNRWYLLGYTLLSFFIPMINIGPMLADRPAGEPVVLRFIPAIGGSYRASAAPVAHHSGISGWTILLLVLTAGAALMLIRLAVRWLSLVRLRRSARPIVGMGVKVYQVEGAILPFSFGNAIYINRELHPEKEWEDIILHEFVHIRQRHTIDIVISELVCVVNWYNPFAWLIRYSVRQNLEFIADQEVLAKGADRKGYQYHLLKVVGEPRYRLANNFNFSSLRKRIVMMNKVRSAKAHLLKLMFLLPLIAILLLAFREQAANLFGSRDPVYVNAAGLVISIPDKVPVAGATVRDRASGLETKTDEKGFFKISIPAKVNAPLRVHLTFAKAGYDSSFGEAFPFTVKETTGVLINGVIRETGAPLKGVYFFGPPIPGETVPVDPDYSDALANWKEMLKGAEELDKYMQLQKDHPEVGLFYETEDARKEIVIYMDGRMERYGYSGGPGLAELYKKFGEIDHYMASDHPSGHLAGAGYLAHWAAISEQAQRDFHTTNSQVRAIIFPGDSRVIAVPATGKPKVYDMDNDADVERTAFEQLYGKLPACVPGAGTNTDELERKAGWPLRLRADAAKHAAAAKKDTVPEGRDSAGRKFIERAMPTVDTASQLFIVDGKKMPANWNISAIPSQLVRDVSVIGSKAGFEGYGEAGRNGVVLIDTKDPGHDWSKEKGSNVAHVPASISILGEYTGPLFIIRGTAVPRDSLSKINPDSIASIDVLKDPGYLSSSAFAKYGEQAKNGVVIIHLKSEKIPLCLVDGERTTLDSLKRINPDRVESVNILDAKDGQAQYGEKGKNGVMLVHLKPPGPGTNN